MAKYDWKQLEKEYILSNYKSVSAFLKDKGISNASGSTKKAVKGWKEKKAQKEHKKGTKIIEKVIEKESEKEAQKIVDIKDVANNLLVKIMQATEELNIHCDMFGGQHESIINRGDVKKLTSALKDLSDILDNNKDSNDIEKVQIINDLPGDEDETD